MADPNIPGNIKDKAKDTAGAASHTAREAAGLAHETASTLGHKAQDTASHLAQRASDAAGDVSQKAKDMASQAGDRADDAIASVGQSMSSLAGSLRQNAPREGMMGTAAGTVADRLEAGGQYLQEHGLGEMSDDLASLIRQHPLPSMAIVFGIGFLLGGALRR
jgi:ElaB/YqjD/DUF883 family membrane-anchored ribosome-binding protein